MNENPITTWPLIFSYRGPILGNGFMAFVDFSGRVLAEQEGDGGVWLSGINPGGVAGGGCNFASAQTALGRCVSDVLVDMAAEAPSFPAFAEAVRMFFDAVDAAAGELWVAARVRVRAEGKTGDDVGLDTERGAALGKLEIVQVLVPADARSEQNYQPAAALAA